MNRLLSKKLFKTSATFQGLRDDVFNSDDGLKNAPLFGRSFTCLFRVSDSLGSVLPISQA
jgi:hypothetical protein